MYVHTPIITGSDCEGAGEMFQRNNDWTWKMYRRQMNGAVDYTQDFFGKETSLTVSGQLNGRDIRTGIWKRLYIWTYIPRRELQHNKTCGRVLDD